MSGDEDPEDELSAEDELYELLETLVEAFGVDATVSTTVDEEQLRGSVDGPGADRLVGSDGNVLEAIQHLAQRIVLRGGGGLRVLVDADGYRARREDALRAEADRVADRALGEGRDVAMRPMPASERRFVHEYLRERGDVATHSEGDEPRRRLVVSPGD
jgi:spoIIIJ-associated protein